MTTTPIARTPLNHIHRQAGATLEIVDSWEVATRYPSAAKEGANTVVDISHLGTHEIGSRRTDEILRSHFQAEIAILDIAPQEACDVYRLTDSRAILFGAVDIPEAIDVTGGWASLALYGPQVREILSKITALDLRDKSLGEHHCCQGPIFGVNTLFGHYPNRYELHVCPDMLEFLYQVLLDAGREFDLQPAGLEQSKHYQNL